MLESLLNKGVAFIGEESESSNRPIIVVGAARGGTSMIAGALAKLGVFMGDLARHPVYEDVKLSKLFESRDFESAKKLAQEYSSRHTLWGWKRPSSIDYLDDVNRCIEDPVYIFVYRDIFAIAQRNKISALSDVSASMEKSLVQYGNTLAFINKKSPRAMLVSYDKALLYSESFVKNLVCFCGLEPTSEQVDSAVRFIQPSPDEYLDNSRITKAQGRIDSVNGRRVNGWARYVHQKKSAVVGFYLNGKLIGRQDASSFRKDLDKKFSQNCSFSFLIPDEYCLKSGDMISAKVEGDVREINNSPFLIE